MKRLSWANVVLLAAVIALALFAYFRPHTDAPEYKLSTLKPVDAKSIKIESASGIKIALERTVSEWQLVAPLTARAEIFQIQRILAILDATTKDRLSANDLARFDLASPTVNLTIDGQTFSFGAVNTLAHEQYILTNGYVYLTKLDYGAALPQDAWSLVSRQLFAEDETPTAFEFPDFKLAQHDGKWTVSPSPKTELSQDDFNRWVDNWRFASALTVQPASHRKPLATINVELKNGRAVKLAVLQRAPQLVLARDDQSAFDYQFTDDAAQQLLTPPGTSSEPQINVDEHK